MIDKTIALVALLVLFAFLGIIVAFVPDPDLTIVSILALSMAAFDFYRDLFKRAGK